MAHVEILKWIWKIIWFNDGTNFWGSVQKCWPVRWR